MNRNISIDGGETKVDDNIVLEQKDFDAALREMKPMFGHVDDDVYRVSSYPILDYGARLSDIYRSFKKTVDNMNLVDQIKKRGVLIHGISGTGKTTLAIKMAMDTRYHSIRRISTDSLIGRSETYVANRIDKVFSDCERSSSSVVLIDDIERLISYSRIGHRYSNHILQTIYAHLKKTDIPNKMIVVVTTKYLDLLGELDILDGFEQTIKIDPLSVAEIKLLGRDVEQQMTVRDYLGCLV
jgi:vesicle-fusing ATPase